MFSGRQTLIALAIALFPVLVPAQEAIYDANGQVVRGSATITIGDNRSTVRLSLGNPAGGDIKAAVWRFKGIEVRFDGQDKVQSIRLFAPFKGETRRGIHVGSRLKDLRLAYANNKKTPEQRLAQGNLSFGMRNEQVLDILMTAPPKRPNRPGRDRPGGDRPGGDRPGGDRPGRDRPGGDRPAPDGRDMMVIWEKEWRAAKRPDWVDGPVRGWPDDRGLLLLRVAYGARGRGGEQLLCGHDASRIENRDYLYKADFVRRQRKSGKPLRWQFRFAGEGRCKVQLIWFESKRRAERYVARHAHESSFAYQGRPGRPGRDRPGRDDWRQRAKLVWDHSWAVRRGDDRLLLGPKEDWPDDEGVVLVRALAGPRVESFLFRPGVGQLQVLAPGDHIFEPDVLDRARRGNFLSGLAGDERKHLQFGFRGRGRARVQVWWLPDRRHCDTFCRETSRESLAPWIVASALPSWIFQGPPKWRADARHESDWRRPGFDDPANLINVAARRNGGLALRSDRDPTLCRGSEFDGGLWYSEARGWAAVESRFYAASELERIEIATAGSDGDAASWISIELQRENGGWDRVGTLRNENINWYRLANGRRAVSRPPLRLSCDPRQRYIALRVVFVGDGPFRVGNLRALGRHVGPPRLEEPEAPVWPGSRLRLPARSGVLDSNIEVRRGERVFLDVDGAISLDADDKGPFGWCGAEGYGSYHCRSAFADARSHAAWQSTLMEPDLPAGALLLRIGDGPFRQLDAGGAFEADRGGRILFAYNLPARTAARGGLQLNVLGGRSLGLREPSSDRVTVRCRGQLKVRASGRGISGVDVIAVSPGRRHEVLGGGRTDADGRYDFELILPPGSELRLRAPEFRMESAPRTFPYSNNFDWNLDLD